MGAFPPHSDMPQLNELAIARFVDIVFGNLEGFVAVREIPESGTGDRKARSAYHHPAELVEVTLLHKSAEGRSLPFPRQTHPTASVTGMPSAVKPLSTATRTWNSAT